MKIQFIICGWWYDEFDGRKGITDFIDGLIELQKDNEFIDVFCFLKTFFSRTLTTSHGITR